MLGFKAGVGLAAGSLILVGCSGSSSHPPTGLPQSPSTTTSAESSQTDRAAFKRATHTMAVATSFRFVADVSRSTGVPLHLIGEFNAPDRLHETVTGSPQGAVELALIGGRAYRRRPDGHWVEAAPANGAGSVTSGQDPRLTFTVIGEANQVTGSGSSYRFTLTGAAARRLDGAASNVSGAATLSGDSISSLEYHGDDPAGTKVAIVYSEIGTAPAVVTPPLG